MTRKRRLGRGLDSLLGEAPAESTGITQLPVDQLQPNRMQPRSHIDEAKLEELAASIREQGLVQPIVVTPLEGDRYAIVAGERRWRASRRAGLNLVPVVVREVSGDRELLELALVENIQRADLNPMEEAEAYRLLKEDFELSTEEIGLRVGKNRSTVSNCLSLLNLPDEVQALLRGGRLTPGQARPLGKLDRERQLELAGRAADEGLTAREMEDLARAAAAAPELAGEPGGGARSTGKAKKRSSQVDVHTAAAQEELTRRLQTRVEIRRRRRQSGGGEIRLHFHSEEELMRLYDQLMGMNS